MLKLGCRFDVCGFDSCCMESNGDLLSAEYLNGLCKVFKPKHVPGDEQRFNYAIVICSITL